MFAVVVPDCLFERGVCHTCSLYNTASYTTYDFLRLVGKVDLDLFLTGNPSMSICLFGYANAPIYAIGMIWCQILCNEVINIELLFFVEY